MFRRRISLRSNQKNPCPIRVIRVPSFTYPHHTKIMKINLTRFALIIAFSATTCMLQAQTGTPAPPPASAPAPAKPKGITITGSAGVNISGPTTICKGGETILKAEGDYESFEWSNGVQDRFLRVREEGTYEVTVTTKGGCRLTTSVTVRMIPCT
jgi:hypothetical protein